MRQVHADVDLPVGLGDFVEDFHSGIADVVCYFRSFELRERVSMGNSRLTLPVLLITESLYGQASAPCNYIQRSRA